MPLRNIYLKIETIPDYSPVDPNPEPVPPARYRRDCMRNPGHEDGTIPLSEVNARRLTALIYREYLDPGYLIPRPDKLILADVNEPPYSRRVPGTVIYTQPGERLRIHVLNADSHPHSLHVHGLEYGIDSDGSWPLGTQSSDGRRSDEICPGESWTYTFDVTDEMVGAWPFHDHYQHVAENINRGLFGGIVVLPRANRDLPPRIILPPFVEDILRHPPRPFPIPPLPDPRPPGGHHSRSRVEGHAPGAAAPRPFLRPVDFLKHLPELRNPYPYIPRPPKILHVPLFFHSMHQERGTPLFDSGDLILNSSFEWAFPDPGEFNYHCRRHPGMQGVIRVVPGGPPLRIVEILDGPMRFDPTPATVAPGGTVRWEHHGTTTHTVTEDAAGRPSFCLNGRSFVGNTPTIVAKAGQKILWYVFNLDVGMMWHNFHPHGQRWRFAQETVDIRSLGPAESFVVETKAPPVLLLPAEIEKLQDPACRPKDARKYKVRGDFLVHCHVEMHMMEGMVALLRSRQSLWLTPAQAEAIAAQSGLPLDPFTNDCPPVDPERCHAAECGVWEEVTGLPEVTMMHAALLPNKTKVLFWGYTGDDQSRLWESAPPGGFSQPVNQPADLAPGAPPPDAAFSDLWSSEHAYLDTPEGKILIHGGLTAPGSLGKQAFLFNPATETWELVQPTVDPRFYSTTLTLPDGTILTILGGDPYFGIYKSIEVYTPGAGWSPNPPKPLPTTFNYAYYPWTYLLPGGNLFIAGPQGVTRRFAWTATPIVDDPAKQWTTVNGDRGSLGGSQNGTSVLLPLRPPGYAPRVLIAGGSIAGTEETSEMIDLSAATPAWVALGNMNRRRNELTSVLLPDGRVFLAGGLMEPEAAGEPAGGPAEIFDPDHPENGWVACASMTHPRNYHSSAILLPDGSVLMGGDPGGGATRHERYYPGYTFRSRPTIAAAPATVNYGAVFTVTTPEASSIAEVVMLRPGAVTHGFNMSQRFVGCVITSAAAGSLQVQAPPDGSVAPPGYYLLFLVDTFRVPSVGRWIRLTV